MKRPGLKLSPNQLPLIVGLTLTQNVKEEQLVCEEHLKT